MSNDNQLMMIYVVSIIDFVRFEPLHNNAKTEAQFVTNRIFQSSIEVSH